MPENVMMNHNYVIAEGGTGVRVLLAAHMYLSSKAYAVGENETENWKFIYETMDAGAEEIEQLQKLIKLDKESKFCDPHYSFYFCKLAEKVKGKLATVYKGNIIKNLIMDCQSYTKYRPNETTGGIFVSWRRKEELPTGA